MIDRIDWYFVGSMSAFIAVLFVGHELFRRWLRGKRGLNTLLTRVSSQTPTAGRRSANATRQVVPSPGSMVAVRWLMRTTVPTTV